MEFEFWWLLAFPVFFGLGWLAARIDIKHLLSESRALPVSYFKGLNFLINEQPDKAIEAFLEVARADQQTTVTAALDGETAFWCGAGSDQVLTRRNEIIEDVLLLQTSAGFVPGGTVLAAAAQVCLGIDTAHFHPRQPRHAEPWRLRHGKPTVAVQQCRGVSFLL